MKVGMRLFVFFLLGIISLFLMISLGSLLSQMTSTPQESSLWQTEDGSFVFYVTENNRKYGKINTDSNTEWVELLIYRDILYIHTIRYFDGKDSAMYWDRIAQYETHDRSDKYWIRRFLFAPDKMEFHCFGESVWGLPETFTMTRVAKDLVPEKIELPPIKLPEYYYLYEKYKDVFDGDLKSFSDFESKYGKCALVRRSESIHDTYYYIAEVDSENCPTYYISIYQTNGNILSAELIRADRLPEGAIRNEW